MSFSSLKFCVTCLIETPILVWAAVETAKKAPAGSVIVAMLPDTGERYLSTPLFASIDADMNEDELEIARSTPSFILEPAA